MQRGVGGWVQFTLHDAHSGEWVVDQQGRGHGGLDQVAAWSWRKAF